MTLNPTQEHLLPDLAVDGLRNLRDLSGRRTADGAVLARGRLYRAEAPCHLTKTGATSLARLGIRTVVDLRDEPERREYPTTLRSIRIPIPPPVHRSGKPLVEAILARELCDFTAEDLGEMYISMLESHARSFGDVFRHIAGAGSLPILVHCAAGKDRTGLVIALILGHLGVGRDEVLDDYAASGTGRAHRIADILPRLSVAGIDVARVEALFLAPRRALELALEHVDLHYGGVQPYLRGKAELDEELLDRVTSALLEESSSECGLLMT